LQNTEVSTEAAYNAQHGTSYTEQQARDALGQ